MKGQPFHYAQADSQWNPVKVATVGALPPCHGTNGPDGVNCARQVCDGTNGPRDGESGTPCTREEPAAAIPHYNTAPEAGRPYQTTGDLHVTDGIHGATSYAQEGAEWGANDEPEKVHTLTTKVARTHTSYYNKQ